MAGLPASHKNPLDNARNGDKVETMTDRNENIGRHKRVLFICPQPFFAWRGSPIRVSYDVEALAQLGYEVDLLTLPIGDDRAIPGVRILRVPRIPGITNIPIGPSPGKLLYDVLLLIRGLCQVIRHQYAAIHGVEEAGAIAWVLGRLSGAAVVFEKHSDPASHKAGAMKNAVLKAYAAVERLIIAGADAVIGTGRTLVAQVRESNPKKAAFHVFDLPSSHRESNPETAAQVRTRLQQNPGEVLALYVGSFAVYQGIDLLFDSMCEVFSSRGNVRLIVIGGSPAEREARQKTLAQRGFSDRVTFAGFVSPDELPNYLAAADILLSPRISGVNSPLKLLDYLKVSRAIVATDLAANREIIDEACAVMAAPETSAFAAGVVQLVDSPELRDRLGKAGRKLIDQTYNMNGFVDRLRVCYSGLRSPGYRLLRIAVVIAVILLVLDLLCRGLIYRALFAK